MTSRTFDAVIFDMDGVLCDSEPFIAAAAAEMLRRTYGVQATRDDFAPFVGAGEDRFIGGAGAAHGVTVTMPRDKDLTYEIYLEMIRGALQPLPGAAAFVRELKAGGLRIAIATAADRIKLVGNLREIGLSEDAFDAVVVGNDVTRKKPDPEGFLLAATRLGADPARCLVVEDAPNGIRAGVAAGARCLGITTTFGEDVLGEAGAIAVAPDLASVPAAIRAALGLT
jgi:beta-phosphoglucomutase